MGVNRSQLHSTTAVLSLVAFCEVVALQVPGSNLLGFHPGASLRCLAEIRLQKASESLPKLLIGVSDS